MLDFIPRQLREPDKIVNMVDYEKRDNFKPNYIYYVDLLDIENENINEYMFKLELDYNDFDLNLRTKQQVDGNLDKLQNFIEKTYFEKKEINGVITDAELYSIS